MLAKKHSLLSFKLIFIRCTIEATELLIMQFNQKSLTESN